MRVHVPYQRKFRRTKFLAASQIFGSCFSAEILCVQAVKYFSTPAQRRLFIRKQGLFWKQSANNELGTAGWQNVPESVTIFYSDHFNVNLKTILMEIERCIQNIV